MFRSILAGIAGLGALTVAIPGAAEAQQRHWFYDNYRYYDGEVFVPYAYRRPVYRYHAYPRWRRIVPPESVVEYEVAPGQWITVLPDGRVLQPPRRGKQVVEPGRQPTVRQAARAPAKTAVPVPKAKPAPVNGDAAASATATAPKTKTATLSADAAAAALDLPPDDTADPTPTGSLGPVSCEQGQKIVADFGFSDVKPQSCSGKTYDFEAIRDGQPYAVKLSAADGELTEVKKR